MQRPNMTPKFRERLARDAENVNAINRHGDIATRIAEKIADHVGFDVAARDAKGTTIIDIIFTELEPIMKVLREAMTHSIIQHASGCRAFNSQPCNCWVSRAQKLIDEEK